jgi:hypothetical protein
MLTWDPTINIGSLLMFGAAAVGFIKFGLAVRDNSRDTKACVVSLQKLVEDHEQRLRLVERRQHPR